MATWYNMIHISITSGGHPRASRNFPTDLANPAAHRVRSLTGSCSRPGVATHAYRAFPELFVARPTTDRRLEKWRVPVADSKRYPRDPQGSLRTHSTSSLELPWVRAMSVSLGFTRVNGLQWFSRNVATCTCMNVNETARPWPCSCFSLSMQNLPLFANSPGSSGRCTGPRAT